MTGFFLRMGNSQNPKWNLKPKRQYLCPMKHLLILILFLSATFKLCAQVVAGPMLGQVELRDARVWLEVSPSVKNVKLQFNKKHEPGKTRWVNYSGITGKEFNPISFTIGGLEPGTTYEYSFVIDGKPGFRKSSFTTKPLWQWRIPAPDFSFLTGSCAYFNEPVYDRPGTPYGGDSSIFKTMAQENASFMLWLGDNWYYREVDYFSKWGLWYRAHHDRSLPVLQDFLKAMPQYAIWDDHDYGPNDADKSYPLKNESLEVFKNYWLNPSYGEDGKGIYTMINYADVDIFMMDDRWFRSSNTMSPVINGQPNPAKKMWGEQEMEWLENALLFSKASFKLIATGNQTLNPKSIFECLQDYPAEFNELMDFLTAEKINGVLFLTGDRHHSEVIRWDRKGSYPLYDITNSPFTSGVSKVTGTKEETNPARVPGTLVEAQNYTRVTVSGAAKNREILFSFTGIKGNVLAQWKINENDLKTK
jgi:alkaline phosphatase D